MFSVKVVQLTVDVLNDPSKVSRQQWMFMYIYNAKVDTSSHIEYLEQKGNILCCFVSKIILTHQFMQGGVLL